MAGKKNKKPEPLHGKQLAENIAEKFIDFYDYIDTFADHLKLSKAAKKELTENLTREVDRLKEDVKLEAETYTPDVDELAKDDDFVTNFVDLIDGFALSSAEVEKLVDAVERNSYRCIKSDSILIDQKIENFKQALADNPYSVNDILFI